MTDTALIAFGSALGGAIVGGAATAYGSYLVATVDRRHNARANIYLDLLPAVRKFAGRDQPSRQEVSSDIRRVAVVAGRRSVRFATQLDAALKAVSRPRTPDDPVKSYPGGGTFADRDAEEAEVTRLVKEFNRYLERRLG